MEGYILSKNGKDAFIQSAAIPSSIAILVSAPYTAAKQFQNNIQLGTRGNPLAMNGLDAVAVQQQLRFLLRMGPIPVVKAWATENKPDGVSDSQAKFVATVCSGTVADALLVPTEGMATKKQTFDPKSAIPKPDIKNIWQSSKTTADFTKEMYRGLSATVTKQTPYWLVLVGTKELIEKYYSKEGEADLTDKLKSSGISAAVATAVNTALTPLSAAQQRMQRYHNPSPSLTDALKETFSTGVVHSYKGASARAGITAISAFGTALTLTAQELYKTYSEEQEKENFAKGGVSAAEKNSSAGRSGMSK